jgi:hypothetical protein
MGWEKLFFYTYENRLERDEGWLMRKEPANFVVERQTLSEDIYKTLHLKLMKTAE